MELGRVDALSEDVSEHLGVCDGVDHTVAVEDDPAEMVEPAEEVLRALGGATLLGELFDGGAVGAVVGLLDGSGVGSEVGATLGTVVGLFDGAAVGAEVA